MRMGRKRLFVSVGLVSGFVALVIIALVVMAKREPHFYRQAHMPPSAQRTQLSSEAQSSFLESLSRDSLQVDLTADQINAFFQEDFLTKLGGDENLPDGFHDPRVRFTDGSLRLGWRWGKGIFSTIVSVEVKFWVVHGKASTLAMEIVSVQAGSLPLSSGFVLDHITSAARRQNIDVSWYRHEGHPVAIMRFQSNQQRPTFQFDDIKLRDGALAITGRASEQPVAPLPRELPK